MSFIQVGPATGLLEAQQTLADLRERIANPRAILLRAATMTLEAAVQDIEIGGNPPWVPDKPPSDQHHILELSGALLASLQAGNSTEIWQGTDEVDVGTSVPYARFLQEGTSHMPARTFLTPSAEQSNDALSSAITDMAQRLLLTGEGA
jgi:HK97 gp10 family phage protein